MLLQVVFYLYILNIDVYLDYFFRIYFWMIYYNFKKNLRVYESEESLKSEFGASRTITGYYLQICKEFEWGHYSVILK